MALEAVAGKFGREDYAGLVSMPPR